jgi:hypothetical protein
MEIQFGNVRIAYYVYFDAHFSIYFHNEWLKYLKVPTWFLCYSSDQDLGKHGFWIQFIYELKFKIKKN